MELIRDEVLSVDVITDTGVGPPGPPGPSGGASGSYEHMQLSAADTWIINHNLGFKPSTVPYTVGGMLMWANVQHFSNNQVRIYFDGPVAGYAICS